MSKSTKQKEDWRQHNIYKEFSKDIKFNKKWYHLIAIFDKDQEDNFDFNTDITDFSDTFDFNNTNTLNQDNPYEYNPNLQLNGTEFDFNSVLLEQFKIKEIGLLMGELNEKENRYLLSNTKQYDAANIVGKNNNFISDFYNKINENPYIGFYVKTALEVFGTNDNKSLGLIFNQDILDAILKTLLQSAAGYTNEGTIQLLKGLNNKVNETNPNKNIISILSKLEMFNTNNKNAFPDTIFRSNNGIIPVDLKVAKTDEIEKNGKIKIESKINFSSSTNRSYLFGIYHTLLGAIANNKNLMEYIQSVNLYEDGKILKSDTYLYPELKGFLVISSVSYKKDNENPRLEYSNISIRPMISCLTPVGNGNWENNKEFLFATKGSSKQGDGTVKYDNGLDTKYTEQGILNGAPLRFGIVVKNFFNALFREIVFGNNPYQTTNIKSLALYIFGFNDTLEEIKKTHLSNIIEIFKAINPNWENDDTLNKEEKDSLKKILKK